jgi:agmatine deiminase
MSGANFNNIRFYETGNNDTWARDHGGITVYKNGKPLVLDFAFNGWGGKFEAGLDNLVTGRLGESGAFDCPLENHNGFILEGGSIETDGFGTILTTEYCLLSKTRNSNYSKSDVEDYLSQKLGARHFLWLSKGYLAGDDTDSHIDTLARFISPGLIAYVKCTDTSDEHYQELAQMEAQLLEMRDKSGMPYKLAPLPMAPPIYFEGERLPATYANFLIMDKAVLFPIYNCSTDSTAIETAKSIFPGKEVVPIDCLPLIVQHGSLHCVTMQYPIGAVI